jgi:uncharacterized membrane protein
LDRRNDQVVTHFYRGVLAHMDVWRQRMDATTNWAAATAAGMITFAFGSPATPHYVLLVSMAFQSVFLLMESRRYQVFDLWRRRFRVLNRAFIVPALHGEAVSEEREAELKLLAADLGRTVPHAPIRYAIGFRVRRNYGYLLAVTLAAWLLKIEVAPGGPVSVAEFADRADIAFVPGSWVLAWVAAYLAALLLLAAQAPTDDMLDWVATDTLWMRWSSRLRRRGRGIGPGEAG